MIGRSRGGSMHDPGNVMALGRRLNRAGAVLLVGALAAFVWAVGFSKGVDGLLEGLVLAVAGFLVPAVALLWIGWVLANASQEPESEPAQEKATPPGRKRALALLQAYLIALAAVALATVIRSWLTPYMSTLMLSPTFLLAVTVSAWVGGMGPAIFATAISVPVLWYGFLHPMSQVERVVGTGDVVGLALFATVALSIAGITSALRITQTRSAALHAGMRRSEAALMESETRFRDAADEAPAMIWMCDASGRSTYRNRAWLRYTGRPLEQELGEGWMEGIHPQDARHCQAALRKALELREELRLEYRLRRSDGSYHPLTDRGRPRFDRDGRFVGFIGACMEVPEPAALPQP